MTNGFKKSLNRIAIISLSLVALFSFSSVFADDAGDLTKLLPPEAKVFLVQADSDNIVKKDGETFVLDVKANFKAAQSLYLYQYHANTNKLELIDDGVVVNAYGEVKVNLGDSISVLSDRALELNLLKPNAPEPIRTSTDTSNTGDNSVLQLAIAGAMIILSLGALYIIKQQVSISEVT